MKVDLNPFSLIMTSTAASQECCGMILKYINYLNVSRHSIRILPSRRLSRISLLTSQKTIQRNSFSRAHSETFRGAARDETNLWKVSAETMRAVNSRTTFPKGSRSAVHLIRARKMFFIKPSSLPSRPTSRLALKNENISSLSSLLITASERAERRNAKSKLVL